MDFKIKIDVNKKERIDKYIAQNSNISRSEAQKLIKDSAIYVNDQKIRKSNFIVNKGAIIEIVNVIEKEINAKPENIPLNIIYEDDHLAVINKASGMVVHPAPGHKSGTLVNALLYLFNNLSNVNGSVRPGIVHRIDKDTSGLLVVAKDNETHIKLSENLKKHEIKRIYLAWVEGKLENKITHINLPIGRDSKNRKKMAVTEENSKNALTHVFVEKILEDRTLVRCELETGRTHQIRVHLSYIKHPLLGDPLYGSGKKKFGQHLHAYQLEFWHPILKKKMKFKVEPPEEFWI